ncbi:MAG: MATE family efflux transporter [Rectinema subterraneum]|uniref:MATE family efflux transporter n=1 Tax=Rectinema subterraneum TaxID=2653714 RepID=UPI003C7E33A3
MELAFLHQSMAQRRDRILNGPISQTLLFLAAPTLMLGIVQALMPLMDGLFINNIAGTLVASSVTFSEPVINMAMALAQGLSVAAMAIIGQLNGRGSFDESKRTSTQIVVMGSMLGCLSAPLLVVAAAIISARINSQISHNVFIYLSLYALVLPFSFLESIYNGLKNANGKPEAPFIRMVLMLILKITFNFVFIYALRLGIVGCVLSSLAANILITVWMFWELFVKKGPDRLELRGFRFDVAAVRQLFDVGTPAMLNTFILNLGFFLINSEVQKYGPVVLNGQGIANNITQVAFILPGAFSSAVTTMVSMNIGAENPSKAKTSLVRGAILSALTAALVIAVIVPLSSRLTILFTRRPDVLEIANRALHIYTYSVIGFGVTITIQGAFIGLGKTRVPLVLGVLRIWFLRYLFILATEKYLKYYAVFWGNLFSNYTASFIAIFLISRTRWESAIRQQEPKSS